MRRTYNCRALIVRPGWEGESELDSDLDSDSDSDLDLDSDLGIGIGIRISRVKSNRIESSQVGSGRVVLVGFVRAFGVLSPEWVAIGAHWVAHRVARIVIVQVANSR